MNYALIFAGGTGQRMGQTSVPKQFLLAYNKPIIVHVIEHFQKSTEIDGIVVVILESYLEKMKQLTEKYKLTKVVSIVSGGKNGQESIFCGLSEIKRKCNPKTSDIVLIHDGVRPLINEATITNNIDSVKKYGNSITVSPAIETILLNCNDDKIIIDRNDSVLARAPQSFYFTDIFEAHLKAIKEGLNDFIDSATLMKYFGHKLYTVIGPVENIKITTPMDYYLFKAILDAKENNQLKLL